MRMKMKIVTDKHADVAFEKLLLIFVVKKSGLYLRIKNAERCLGVLVLGVRVIITCRNRGMDWFWGGTITIC